MLVDFAVVIGIASVSGTCKIDRFLMSLFPTIITKEILGRNVILISFVGRIAIVIARR
jgi:hypothetical protein